MTFSKINRPEHQRNFGFWNEAEQEKLGDSVIAIAGSGGDGHDLTRAIVMMASPKEVRIADPETFTPENSNRVAWADTTTYGRLKVDVMEEGIRAMRPDTNVVVYKEGVTTDNVEEFVKGADLVLDESELTYLHVGTALSREARKNNIPNLLVMNIGFAAIATSFDPNARYTFERMMGIPQGMPLDEVADLEVDFSRCLPYVPSYGDISTLRAVEEGAPLPSVVQGVKIASALGSTEAFLHLTSEVHNRRRKPTFAPKWRYMDAMNGQSGVIHHPRANYYGRVALAALRSGLNMNPETSYTLTDRQRRGLE
jgi:tRNA threonylcarbamoyladenosine dehydratase